MQGSTLGPVPFTGDLCADLDAKGRPYEQITIPEFEPSCWLSSSPMGQSLACAVAAWSSVREPLEPARFWRTLDQPPCSRSST